MEANLIVTEVTVLVYAAASEATFALTFGTNFEVAVTHFELRNLTRLHRTIDRALTEYCDIMAYLQLQAPEGFTVSTFEVVTAELAEGKVKA